jgi:NhaP-type Na+/H+ or K+/H+ antiporter
LLRSITGREDIVTMTFAVVGLYVFVQTLVMIPLLRRLGVIRAGV